MSNNFLTFSRIFFKILPILVYIVLSMKSSGLDAINFRILTIVNRLRFSNVLGGRIFWSKKCFTARIWRENVGSCILQWAVAFQSEPDTKNRAALKGLL